jgi:hypothetical protein
MRLVNFANFTSVMKWGENFTQPSKTVPNMTLSLKELLERYVRGQDVSIFEGSYDADQEDMPDVSRMDQMERLDLARNIRAQIDYYQKNPVDPRDPVPPHNERTNPVPAPPPDVDPVPASV